MDCKALCELPTKGLRRRQVNSRLADDITDTPLVRTLHKSPAKTVINCIAMALTIRTLAITALWTLYAVLNRQCYCSNLVITNSLKVFLPLLQVTHIVSVYSAKNSHLRTSFFLLADEVSENSLNERSHQSTLTNWSF